MQQPSFLQQQQQQFTNTFVSNSHLSTGQLPVVSDHPQINQTLSSLTQPNVPIFSQANNGLVQNDAPLNFSTAMGNITMNDLQQAVNSQAMDQVDPNKSPFLQDPNKSPFIQDPNKSPFIQDPNKSPFIQDPNKSPFIQDPNKSPFIQDPNKSPFIQDPNRSPFVQQHQQPQQQFFPQEPKSPYINQNDPNKSPFINQENRSPFINQDRNRNVFFNQMDNVSSPYMNQGMNQGDPNHSPFLNQGDPNKSPFINQADHSRSPYCSQQQGDPNKSPFINNQVDTSNAFMNQGDPNKSPFINQNDPNTSPFVNQQQQQPSTTSCFSFPSVPIVNNTGMCGNTMLPPLVDNSMLGSVQQALSQQQQVQNQQQQQQQQQQLPQLPPQLLQPPNLHKASFQPIKTESSTNQVLGPTPNFVQSERKRRFSAEDKFTTPKKFLQNSLALLLQQRRNPFFVRQQLQNSIEKNQLGKADQVNMPNLARTSETFARPLSRPEDLFNSHPRPQSRPEDQIGGMAAQRPRSRTEDQFPGGKPAAAMGNNAGSGLFRNPSLPTSPIRAIKKKHRPEPLVIPPYLNNYGFQSRLRSPRLWEGGEHRLGHKGTTPPPYTPPPMLSPIRSGSGLFWTVQGPYKPYTPKSAPITPRTSLSRRGEFWLIYNECCSLILARYAIESLLK